MNSKNEYFLVLFGLSLVRLTLQNVVTLAQGRMSGIARDGYVSYVGIPYASVKYNGRFKAPGLAPTWGGIRQSHDPHCSSTSAAGDCLQLDVHVPVSGAQIPVMVWIKGSSGLYHPGKLVNQGIIVVVVRHRLGPLGFLCSEKGNIPGNAGMKDAVQALRWIRDNIIAFNGNPHKVILAGQGFGAAMVESLMLSPSSRELFHGVILQSGSILCPWTINYDAEDRAQALLLKTNSSEGHISSIMKTDGVSLWTAAEEIDFPYMPFGICIEKQHKNEESIIAEPPIRSFSNGKIAAVPVLMGYNSNEAYIFASMLKEAKITQRMAKDLAFLLPEEFQNLSERDLIQITKQIKDMYFTSNNNMTAVLSYHRDAYFLSHIYRSFHFHTKAHHPVYFYQFSYSGNIGVGPEPGLRKTGAAHSDELAYLFPQNGKSLEDDDGIVQDHLVRLWTSFVKHLDPTPGASSSSKWEPTGSSYTQILDINTEIEMKEFPNVQAVHMWEQIYEKYYYAKKLTMVTM